jgi:hypothetical protein
MKIIPIEDFKSLKDADFNSKMITTALELFNIKYAITTTATIESVEGSATEIALRKGLDLSKCIVVYAPFEAVPDVSSRWICVCFEIASAEELVKMVSKTSRMKAFL